jgi:hypothetical protein
LHHRMTIKRQWQRPQAVNQFIGRGGNMRYFKEIVAGTTVVAIVLTVLVRG